MAPSTPENKRPIATTVLTKSPVAIHHRSHGSPSRTAARSSPGSKTIHQKIMATNNSSPSRGVSGTATTTSGGAAGPSQLSKEAARYAKQLKALTGGWSKSSTPLSTSLSIATPKDRARVGGNFLNSGSSISRFSASATAGLNTTAGGRGGLQMLQTSSILKDSNKDNISNNSSVNTPATPASSNNNSNNNNSDSKLSSNKSLFLASLSASSSTPKSILGKRSSTTAGLLSTTPLASSSTTSQSPFVSAQLGSKTPVPHSSSLSTSKTMSALLSTSPRRRSFGRVASAGPSSMKSMAAQAASSLTRTISSGGLTTKLEVVTNDWLGGGSSPKRGRKVYNQGDRFIPNRSATNMSSAQAKLDLVRHPSFSGSTADATDEASIAYNQQIAEACGINLDSRMLAFSAEPPSLDSIGGSCIGAAASANRKIYSRHPSFTRSTSNLLLKKRTILTSPEKVLDAPGLMDDYYLNLLDWSCSNMIAIGLDKSVFIWDAESGHAESLVTMTGNTDAVASVSWACDGLYLAIGTFDGDTQIWDIETKTKVRSMAGHVARVGVLAWDKHILSSGCRDGSIWNHDVRIQNHKVAELSNHTNEVCGLSWRADGQQLASGGNDNLVNIWDARSTVPKYTKPNHTAAVKALAWCPWQNNLLASGGGTYDKQIHFWNTTTGARVNTLNTGSQVTSIVWSTEYKEFMSSHGFPDNNISVYGYPSMNKIIDIPAHDSRILHTALSPDGQTVATVASDENLKFWKLFEKKSISKKDSRTGKGTLSRAGSFCRLGDDEDDDRGNGGPSGSGGPGNQGTVVKGRSLSSMTRIR
ncbi:ubiquitin-protein transferase activating protein [Mortierella sp. AD094]|nr:ubiquitin-protein transferase activating protein [Mortierella sp. AD094]